RAGTYARDAKYLRVDRRDSIELRLDTLRRLAVIGFAAELTLAQFRNDGAGRGQALAIDLGRLLPEFRAHDRFGAMEINALDMNDEHTARQLAVDGEALHQFRIDGDRCATVQAPSFTHTRNQEQKRDARIADDVAESVDCCPDDRESPASCRRESARSRAHHLWASNQVPRGPPSQQRQTALPRSACGSPH